MAHVRIRQLTLVGACVVLFLAIEALSLSHQTRRPLDSAGATAPNCATATSPSPAAANAVVSPSPTGATSPDPSASPCASPSPDLSSTQVDLGSGTTGKPTVNSDLSLTVPPPVLAGQELALSFALKAKATPVPGAQLTLGFNGKNLLLLTDAQGNAQYSLKRSTPPGTYPLSVSFAGDSTLRILPAKATGQVTVLPRIGTAVTLSLPPATMFDHEVPISAVLTAGGVPMPDATLNLSIDGIHKLDLIADPTGAVSYRLARGIPPGAHEIAFSYHGDPVIGIAPASASGTLTILPPVKTSIDLGLPQPTKAGQKMTIAVTLNSDNGPLSHRAVHLSIDGKPKLELITDDAGRAHLDVSRSTPAATYSITAEYHGDRPGGLAPSSQTGTMTILPLTFSLQTVPAMSGVTLHVDGASAKSDAEGVATVPVATIGDHNLSLDAPNLGPGARTQFDRWSDGSTTASRPIRMLADSRIFASFSADYLTSFRFVDGSGSPVDSSRLSAVTAGGPGGTTIALAAPFSPIWLHLPAPSRAVLAGLEPIHKYSVASAQYEGISVINRGDDAYIPHANGVWTIRLRVYSLNIHTRNPVIGGGIPKQVELSLQGGGQRTVALDSNGNASLPGLPRGHYTVSPIHSRLAAEVTLSLTRSQDVTMPVVSRLEIGLALSLLTLLFCAMILLPARRWLVVVHLVQSLQTIHS